MPSKVFLPQRLYGVIGWPLAQSLSPLLHNIGFQTIGIDSVYMRWEISPEDLPTFVESVRLLPISGCSITIPHKVNILPLLDNISEQARLTGAVNTLYWQDDALIGDNTDVNGFLAPLGGMDLVHTDALVLGAGGAARAVVTGLHLCKCRNIHICTPSNKSHLELAKEFSLHPIDWEERHTLRTGLVVNTTPLGMRGKHEEASPYVFSETRPTGGMPAVAYDIVYNPLETRFLHEARQAGWQTISGLEMFYGQGDAQFRHWTGQGLPLAARQTLMKTLGCV